MRKQARDQKIEEILTSYAEELKPDRSVTDRARAFLEQGNAERAVREGGADLRMSEKPARTACKPKSGSSAGADRPRKKPVFRRIAFGAAIMCAAICCVFTGIGVVRFTGGVLLDFKAAHHRPVEDPVTPPPDPNPSYKISYSFADLVAKKSSLSELPEEVDLAWLDRSDESIQIVEVRQFRFRGREDQGYEELELAYVRIKLRIDNGLSVDELEVNIEVTDKFFNEFSAYLDNGKLETDTRFEVRGATLYIDGEYCSSAYFRVESGKFYFSLMTPERESFGRVLEMFTEAME